MGWVGILPLQNFLWVFCIQKECLQTLAHQTNSKMKIRMGVCFLLLFVETHYFMTNGHPLSSVKFTCDFKKYIILMEAQPHNQNRSKTPSVIYRWKLIQFWKIHTSKNCYSKPFITEIFQLKKITYTKYRGQTNLFALKWPIAVQKWENIFFHEAHLILSGKLVQNVQNNPRGPNNWLVKHFWRPNFILWLQKSWG